jgi:exosome complex component CSL4
MERIETIKSKTAVIPGEKLATIEEFVPGEGTASLGESIVSTVLGDAEPDMTDRVMNVRAVHSADSQLPHVGEYVIGRVDSAQPSMAQITIIAVRDLVSDKELSGMLSLRDDRRRRSSPLRSGDTIRAKVISTKNSIYHLAMDDAKTGIVRTVCANCGGEVIALGTDRVKCRDCGFVDERMVSEDFVKFSRNRASL